MQIRKATMNDLPDILAIYAYAREYMKEHGNPDQWKDNYPPLELTTQDIRSGCLHVCIIRANDRERIGGVFYFHPEEDPDYLNIDGSWLNSCPYAVVHRVATAPDTKGIATFCLNWAYEYDEDIRNEQQLLNDPKERAEHTMLVDLGRNDIGKVSEFGSVTVTDMMIVERYSKVMHLVSNVKGTLREDKKPLDALMAVLPAGTLSGAPKVRAMEIIDELETTKRGLYGGTVGYLAFDGSLDTCIAIRTVLFKNNKAYIQAGGGVVADSVPENEYQESCNKAMAVINAIKEASKL